MVLLTKKSEQPNGLLAHYQLCNFNYALFYKNFRSFVALNFDEDTI